MHCPKTRSDLQEIIKAARQNGTHLVPVSSGAPHIHGISANDNAETLDMSKMNKIMKINRANRYAPIISPAKACSPVRLNLSNNCM